LQIGVFKVGEEVEEVKGNGREFLGGVVERVGVTPDLFY
jgi:hypothetical protein